MNKPSIIVVMGVSGSGKSTVGKLLSRETGLNFYDADDYHPQENIDKMAAGSPLNDHDRQAWLERLNLLMSESMQDGGILACSALKEKYRIIMKKDVDKDINWIYLDGSFEEIQQRMNQRTDHFMPGSLLHSQFDTLEIPEYAIRVPISQTAEEIVSEILSKLP